MSTLVHCRRVALLLLGLYGAAAVAQPTPPAGWKTPEEFRPRAESALIDLKNLGIVSAWGTNIVAACGSVIKPDGAHDFAKEIAIGPINSVPHFLPVAIAKSSQAGTSMLLDGSNSYDPNGHITDYVWSENGRELARVAQKSVDLSAGPHHLILTVTDNSGMQDSDELQVTVQQATTLSTATSPDPVPTDSKPPGAANQMSEGEYGAASAAIQMFEQRSVKNFLLMGVFTSKGDRICFPDPDEFTVKLQSISRSLRVLEDSIADVRGGTILITKTPNAHRTPGKPFERSFAALQRLNKDPKAEIKMQESRR